jgi:Ca2+-binding RTX toxin-like protein
MVGFRLAATVVGMAIILNGWAVPAQAATRCFGKRATIVGTGRADRLIGTPRADVIIGLAGPGDLIKGRGGNDLICGNQGRDRIFGGAGHDKIKGENGIDDLFGRRGRDLLRTGGNIYGFRWGVDVGHGGGGADTLIGTPGIDQFSGGRGNDVIRGRGAEFDDCDCSTKFVDLLLGGEGDDSIVGGPTSGTNVSGEVFIGGPGADRLDGGSDGSEQSINAYFLSDGVSYASAPGPVNVDLELGTAQGQGHDTLIGISSAFGSAFGDTLLGDDRINWLRGGSSDDSLSGRAGDDFLGGYSGNTMQSFDTTLGRRGDSGDDVMEGGPGGDDFTGSEPFRGFYGPKDVGDDSYIGGDDVDHLTFNCLCLPFDRAVTVDLAAGTATGWGSDSVAELENITGGVRSDVLLGDSSDNVLTAGQTCCGGGSDTLSGRTGNDRLHGDANDDVLSGGDGDDFLDGNAGTNSNDGGAGFDTCRNPDTDGGAVDCEA